MEFYKRKKLSKKLLCYIGLMYGLIISFFFLLLMFPQGNQISVFFLKSSDYMGDFFNVAKYSSLRNPYFYGLLDNNPQEHMQPPRVYLIFYFFSRFSDYISLSAFEAGRTSIGLLSSNFIIFIMSLLLFFPLYSKILGNRIQKVLILFTLIFSSIFLFAFERGNHVILSAACSTFFIFYYKNNNKYLKELSYISLAFAASLKLTPALLGLLLIYDGNFKDSLRLILYGFLLTFIPFIFLEGHFENISLLINNLTINSRIYGFLNFPRFGFRYWLFWFTNLSFISNFKESLYSIFGFLEFSLFLFALSLNFYHKQNWKKITQLILIFSTSLVNSAQYNGLYFFPAIVLFLNSEDYSKFDLFYILLFVLILNPLRISFEISGSQFSLSTLLMNLSTILLTFSLTFESLRNFLVKPSKQVIKFL
jgi:hypothetical protein